MGTCYRMWTAVARSASGPPLPGRRAVRRLRGHFANNGQRRRPGRAAAAPRAGRARRGARALMSDAPLTGCAFSFSWATRNSHVLSMPFLTEMGLAPAVTYCARPGSATHVAASDTRRRPSCAPPQRSCFRACAGKPDGRLAVEGRRLPACAVQGAAPGRPASAHAATCVRACSWGCARRAPASRSGSCRAPAPRRSLCHRPPRRSCGPRPGAARRGTVSADAAAAPLAGAMGQWPAAGDA